MKNCFLNVSSFTYVCILELAQKIGLVEAPKPGLTESDWQTVKQLSLKRGDSTQPCVICKEDFELREQVCVNCL